jgi:hypothetical protein
LFWAAVHCKVIHVESDHWHVQRPSHSERVLEAFEIVNCEIALAHVILEGDQELFTDLVHVVRERVKQHAAHFDLLEVEMSSVLVIQKQRHLLNAARVDFARSERAADDQFGFYWT